MDEKTLIGSKRSYTTLAILNITIVLIYLLFCMIMYASNDGWTTFGYWFGQFIFPLLIVLLGLNLSVIKSSICVTNMRVYGNSLYGKRVDLPLDSISAVGTSWGNGLVVSTSSGKISFFLIANRDDIHKCISTLLIERQSKPNVHTTKQENLQSNADELKKYKELLDCGAITQEEFDTKKKQLLGL